MIEKKAALAKHLDIPYIVYDDIYYTNVDTDDLDNANIDYELYNDTIINISDELEAYFNENGYNLDNEIDFVDNDKRYIIGDQEYLICTDEEADKEHVDSLDRYIDDVVLSEIPKHYHIYFDKDAFIKDNDGDRGNELGYYDGCENCETIDDIHYYIYRQN